MPSLKPRREFSQVRISWLAITLCLAGCATAPLAPPDMTEDWTVLQGQAIWKLRGGPSIAGELMMATNSMGDFVVEFSKPPLAIAAAQRSGNRWQAQFPAEKKSYGGRGSGPKRLIWLHLAPALAGRPQPWQFVTNENGWRLESGKGEALEGFLAP